MNKEKAQELLNSNGDIKQFLTSAPLNFTLPENVIIAYQGWIVAERKLPNGKSISAFIDDHPYIIRIPTPILVSYDEIQPCNIDDNSLRAFSILTLNIGTTPRYDISENYDDIKKDITINYDVFNYYLTTKGQPLLTRIINLLTYIRDTYKNSLPEEKYSDLMFKILDLKQYYNLKLDFKDMTWEMNI